MGQSAVLGREFSDCSPGRLSYISFAVLSCSFARYLQEEHNQVSTLEGLIAEIASCDLYSATPWREEGMHRLPLSFAHTDLLRSLCCHSCVLGRPAVRPTRWRPCRATRPQDVREMLRESLATPPADTTDAYHEAAQFLREQGFNDTEEVNRILDIAMNPNSLHRSFRSRKRTGISVVSSIIL